MSKYKSSYHAGGCSAALIPIAIWGYFVVCWVVNLVMLLSCDFQEPWKDEIVHAIGLIGPAAGITVWF